MQCEIGSSSFYIRKVPHKTRELKITRCCHREEEILYTMTYDDVYNMSSADFIKLLHNLYKITPKNHDYKTYYYCKTHEKVCNYCDSYFDTIYVDILTNCNLHCSFCNIYKHYITTDEDLKVYFDILNKLKKNNLKTLYLTCQGEPFFYKKETFDYLTSITSNDFKTVFIITNGTMLNFEDIVKLYNITKNNNIKISVIVSCSGISPETYKKSHNNNNFYKVVENAKLLNYFNLLCSINFVISPENLHELLNLKAFWNNYGIKSYQVTGSVIIDEVIEYQTKSASKIVLESQEYKIFKDSN